MHKPPQEIQLISDVTKVADVTVNQSNEIDQPLSANLYVTDVTTDASNSYLLLTPEEVVEAHVEPHVPVSDRPCWKVYDDFTKLDNSKVMRPGTYLMDVIERDEDIIPVERWVCSPLHINAQTRDDKSNNFGRLLRFKDSVGNWKIWAMPMELLRGSGEELRGTLLAMGVLIAPDSFRLLTNYLLQTVPPKNQLHCSTQTGWHGRHAYVLPDQVIGPNADKVVFQSSQAAHEEFRVAGTLEEWREGISSKAISNPMLMLGLSCAFVGPLLALTHSEGGGIHMVGDSSSGKSTIARAASSVWGGKEYRRSWRTTSNGLESAAALFNDGFLVLDEISECDPKDVGEIAYSLGNGYGKQRANRYGSARPVTRWLCFALSNGERTLATAISEGGGRVKTGQSMRLLDLPTKRIHGVWDNLHGFAHGAGLAEHISSAAVMNYGHAGRAYLKRLTHDTQNFNERLHAIKSLPTFMAKQSDGQDNRAAGRFALIALAGELASEYDITGWFAGHATEAAAIGYTAWKAQRGEGSGEKRQIFNSLSDFIETHGDSRFSDMDSEATSKIVRDRAGYWHDDGHTRTYYLTSGAMKEALKGFDLKLALDVLQSHGIVSANNKGERAQTVRVQGTSVRLYKIDFERLQNDGMPVLPAQFPSM